MKKFALSLMTAFVFLFTSFYSAFPALAYSNSNYYSDIRIGLTTMDAAVIDVVPSGDYMINGVVLKSGTSLRLEVSNGKVLYGGVEYDVLTLSPVDANNTLKLRILDGVTKEYSYLGTMAFKVSGDKILPINSLNIEDYLIGVVPYEMSEYYPLEALKAQAVAARTYALANIGKYGSSGYDMNDTTDCQVYRGFDPSDVKAAEAVRQTRGNVLLYDNSLIGTYYSASNGGYTEASENVWMKALPYLKSKPDEFDNDPSYEWVKSFTTAEIENTLKDKLYLGSTDTFVKIDLNTITRYVSQRISRIDVIYIKSTGETVTRSFSKESARTFLGLKSSLYNVSFDNGTYTFNGKGNGHGIGMSQIGARERAKAGQAFSTILDFYYEGTSLANLSTGIQSFSLDKTTLLQGDAIAFTGQAFGGAVPVYKYVVKNNGTVVQTRDYDENSVFSYVPQEQGSYTVTLYVKDKDWTGEVDSENTQSFTVYGRPAIASIPTSPEKPLEKKSVTVSVNASGGSPEGLSYKYEILKDGNIVASGSSAQATFSFTPDSAGNYTARAYVKDKLSQREYDDVKEAALTVAAEPVVAAPAPSSAPKPVVPAFKPSRTLKRGTSGADVKRLQEILKQLGFYKISIDGKFGPGTVSAVQAFQRAKGLKADGIAGSGTISKINAALGAGTVTATPAPQAPGALPSRGVTSGFTLSRTLRYGVRGSDVKALQQALKTLGYYNSTLDGVYGRGTLSAVQAFQRAKGLKADGVVGSGTAGKINSLLK